ncbi:MAG: hypothetical protein IPG94_20730 [Kineosporiaceae bacterium]|nr:hypothetical protein [Kineosporiaceae bacterium]
MKLRTRMNAAVGAGVLATLSLTAWGLSSAQAAPVTGAAASAALAHRMISVHEPKGRAGDGHGGEHSGGSSRDGHHSKAKPKGKKADNRHDNHGGGTNGNNGGDHGGVTMAGRAATTRRAARTRWCSTPPRRATAAP